MIAQIYEIQTQREAETCIELGVDHLGSILASNTAWRQPTLKDVMRATAGSAAKNSLIPPFNEPEVLYNVLDYYKPHYIHFCESLVHADRTLMDMDRLAAIQSGIKERFPEIGIIRSIPIPPERLSHDFPTLAIAATLEPVSDFFLTDTWLGKEPVDGHIGITGRPQDWALAADLIDNSGIPVILAGGLSPENVYDATLKTLPAGADSCTLTNAPDADGRPVRFNKDFSRVRKFVKEIRRAEKTVGAEIDAAKSRLAHLKAKLEDREAALPAHSIRPHQLQIIEELEEEIVRIKQELQRLEKTGL